MSSQDTPAVGDNSHSDSPLLIDAAEGVVGVDDGHDVAESQGIQVVFLDGFLVEHLDVVVPTINLRVTQARAHDLSWDEMGNGNTQFLFLCHSHPGLSQLFHEMGTHAHRFDTWDILQFKPNANSFDLHFVADDEFSKDTVVGKIDHDVLRPSVLADNPADGSFGLTRNDANLISDAGKGVQSPVFWAGAAVSASRIIQGYSRFDMVAGDVNSRITTAKIVGDAPCRREDLKFPV